MPGNDLPNLLSILAIVLTGVIIWFAKRTFNEATKATNELRTIVSKLQTMGQATESTAASSADAARLAKETVAIATAGREADRRHRQLEQLRTISRLVEDIAADTGRAFATTPGGPSPTWRSPEQNQLKPALFDVDTDLPKCRKLAGANGAYEVQRAAAEASAELDLAFRALDGPAPSSGALDGTSVSGSPAPGS